jgi:hypothetical protein
MFTLEYISYLSQNNILLMVTSAKIAIFEKFLSKEQQITIYYKTS